MQHLRSLLGRILPHYRAEFRREARPHGAFRRIQLYSPPFRECAELTKISQETLTLFRNASAGKVASLMKSRFTEPGNATWASAMKAVKSGEMEASDFKLVMYEDDGNEDPTQLNEDLVAGIRIYDFKLLDDWIDHARQLQAQLNATTRGSVFTARMGAGISPWHWDMDDIVVVHTEGEKLWKFIGPFPDQPYPIDGMVLTVLPQFRDPHSHPSYEILMKPGDVMFIPRGISHLTEAKTETSTHVTFVIQQTLPLELNLSTMVGAGVRSREEAFSMHRIFMPDLKSSDATRESLQRYCKEAKIFAERLHRQIDETLIAEELLNCAFQHFGYDGYDTGIANPLDPDEITPIEAHELEIEDCVWKKTRFGVIEYQSGYALYAHGLKIYFGSEFADFESLLKTYDDVPAKVIRQLADRSPGHRDILRRLQREELLFPCE